MIDLDDLRTVLAVVEAGGVIKAAQSLHRVPSAVSMRLQNLENRLSVTLFEKRGRQLSPTSHALALAEDARKILSLVRETESKITNEEPHGVLRFGATDHLVGTRLSRPISKLLKHYPKIDLSLKVAPSERIKEAILCRELDAGVVLHSKGDGRLTSIPLFREKLVVITPKNRFVLKEELSTQTALVFHTTGQYYSRCLEWFDYMGTMPARIIELQSYSAIVGSVAGGLGLAIVPFYWLKQFNCFDMVSVHPLPKSLAFVQVDLMYLRAENSPNIKALKEVLLQKSFKQEWLR